MPSVQSYHDLSPLQGKSSYSEPGFPGHPRTSREPQQTKRRKTQSPEGSSGRSVTEYRTMNDRAGHLCGFMPFSRIGREAPVRTEPLPTIQSSIRSSESEDYLVHADRRPADTFLSFGAFWRASEESRCTARPASPLRRKLRTIPSI
jgi:hypothetical protein